MSNDRRIKNMSLSPAGGDRMAIHEAFDELLAQIKKDPSDIYGRLEGMQKAASVLIHSQGVANILPEDLVNHPRWVKLAYFVYMLIESLEETTDAGELFTSMLQIGESFDAMVTQFFAGDDISEGLRRRRWAAQVNAGPVSVSAKEIEIGGTIHTVRKGYKKIPLDHEEREEIRSVDKELKAEFPKKFPRYREVARRLGISESRVRYAIEGRRDSGKKRSV